MRRRAAGHRPGPGRRGDQLAPGQPAGAGPGGPQPGHLRRDHQKRGAGGHGPPPRHRHGPVQRPAGPAGAGPAGGLQAQPVFVAQGAPGAFGRPGAERDGAADPGQGAGDRTVPAGGILEPGRPPENGGGRRLHRPAGRPGGRRQGGGQDQSRSRRDPRLAGGQTLRGDQGGQGQAPARAGPALHHLHPAAGRQPGLRLFGHPHDAGRPDAV